MLKRKVRNSTAGNSNNDMPPITESFKHKSYKKEEGSKQEICTPYIALPPVVEQSYQRTAAARLCRARSGCPTAYPLHMRANNRPGQSGGPHRVHCAVTVAAAHIRHSTPVERRKAEQKQSKGGKRQMV